MILASVAVLLGGTGLLGTGAATAAPSPGPGVAEIIPIGGSTGGVAVDPVSHQVYIGNYNEADLSVIDWSDDANTGKVTAIVALPGEQVPVVAVDPSTHNVYAISNDLQETTWLSVIDESGDANTGKVIATTRFSGGSPSAVAVDPSTHHVYVVDAFQPVTVIDEAADATRGQIIATIPTIDEFGDAIAIDPTNHNVYVGYQSDAVVAVIDESGDVYNGKVTAVISAGANDDGLFGLAVDASNHNVYVTNDEQLIDGSGVSNITVSVIDESGNANNGTVTSTIRLAPGDVGGDDSGIAVDPSTHTVYTYDGAAGLVAIDESGDASSGKVIGTVPGVLDGRYLAIDPANHNIYASGADGSVTVISPPADATIAVTAPASVATGSQFTETATITDYGPYAATDTVTNLLIPAGLSVTSAPGATARSGTLVWVDPSLASGASVIYHATFTVGASVHATTAIGGDATSALYDPNPVNNAAIAIIRLG